MGDEEEPPGPRRNPGSYYRSNRQVCQPQSEWAGGKPLASVAGIAPSRYTSLTSLRFTVQWIYASLVAHWYLLYEDTRIRYSTLLYYYPTTIMLVLYLPVVSSSFFLFFQMQQEPKESVAMGPRTRPPKLWFVWPFHRFLTFLSLYLGSGLDRNCCILTFLSHNCGPLWQC